MLGFKLDPDLELLLERDVDDLAKYNILRYLHDSPRLKASAEYFAEELGLRPPDRVVQMLEELARSGLLSRTVSEMGKEHHYGLSDDPERRQVVERLYQLSSSEAYGDIVERLAARSLHRAKRGMALPKGGGRSRAVSPA